MPNSWIEAKAFSLPRFRSDTQKLALCVSAVMDLILFLICNLSYAPFSLLSVKEEETTFLWFFVW